MSKKKRNKFDKDGYESTFDGLKSEDFITVKDELLPSPAEFARAMKNARITIHLDSATIDFFKAQAKQHHVSYQKMIRHVLRNYREQVRRRAA
jgi:predicted DNA binding CopG/RHH family protein